MSDDVGVLVAVDDEDLQTKAILDYTSRDYLAIRSQLVGLAKGLYPDWNTAGEPGDFGTLLLELFSYLGDTLNFYIDRTASEAFLSTAVRPQSVYYIADMLGYSPVGQQAARVTLSFSMQDTDPGATEPLPDITLPVRTRVTNSTSNSSQLVVFETVASVTLSPGTSVDVLAQEGITVLGESLGTSFGVPNTEFRLANKGVIFGTISIRSQLGQQSQQWAYTSSLSTARATQPVFTTYLDDDGYTHVIFGDNTSGRVPAVGSGLFATYRYGVGARANDLASKALSSLVPDASIENLWAISVTNLESPVGGADPESVESMKYSIPRGGARIRSRAVTLNDYADLALQVPGVAKSVSYGTVYTSVKVRIAPAGGVATEDIMAVLCDSVEQYMSDKVLIGSTVVAEPRYQDEIDALWQTVFLRLTIHVNENYNRTAVWAQVKSVMKLYLDFDSVDFGMKIKMGDIYRAALTVQGVDWCEIRWLSPTQPPETDQTQIDIPESTSQTLFSSPWKHETTGGAPAAGEFKISTWEPATPTTAVTIDIHDLDATTPSAIDYTVYLNDLRLGDHVLVRTVGEGASWWDFIVSSIADNSTYVTLTTNLSRASSLVYLPADDQMLSVEFLRYSPTPASSGEVADIETDELKIPRYDQTEVTEDPANWPTYWTEDQLTHDGLWVLAYGGLAGS